MSGASRCASAHVESLPSGFARCYLVRAEGAILVDAGGPGSAPRLLRELEARSVRPGDLRLVLLTHGHLDHLGGAAEMRQVHGAPIALHRADAPWARLGELDLAPGVTRWGRCLEALLRRVLLPLLRRRLAVRTFEPDRLLDDGELDLASFGIPGRVLPTPGHTAGSVTVLLEGGDALAGDLVMNALPLCRRPSLAVFAHDRERLRESWRRIVRRGARRIYPGHGAPFAADAIPTGDRVAEPPDAGEPKPAVPAPGPSPGPEK